MIRKNWVAVFGTAHAQVMARGPGKRDRFLEMTVRKQSVRSQSGSLAVDRPLTL
jgi:hypothetical protein